MDSNDKTQGQASHVGPDWAIVRNRIVHIYARREIPDWTVREFRRQVIFFRGAKYYLRLREKAASPYACHYELAPWPENLHEHSDQSYAYDEDLVAERDHAAVAQGATSVAHAALLALYPFLGFFWSGFKDRVFIPLGFVPASITAASTWLEFLFLVVDGILFGFLGGGLLAQISPRELLYPLTHEGPMALLDLVILVVLALDCAIRYSQVL
ncbi:MAG: hypothetical protein NTW03_05600, partial [Verrucomicrobia bacterium]|nr:hypothetical protein [Verrucomicrobiota bacterium]